MDHELDCLGLLCPLPVLKLIATDPASVIDVPHFCNEQGHELLSHEVEHGRYIFRIRRK